MASYSQQESIGSQADGEWSDEDPVYVLPYEVVSHILDYVPLRELVRVCMLVSQRWRKFLTDPTFWKVRMRRGGNYSPELDAISNAEWPKLCLYSVYEPNWIRSFDKDQKLSFTHWKWTSMNWHRFKISSCPARQDDSHRGFYWEIENEWIDPERDEEVFKENSGCVSNYATSYKWGCREQLIRLANVGLSNEIMDKVQPSLEVSEWFAARWDCGSEFCIRVELMDAERAVVKFFEHSVVTEQWLGGELGWRKLEHVFREYGPGVRYLRFADAGKDTQFWAGFYGSKMAAAWARVKFS